MMQQAATETTEVTCLNCNHVFVGAFCPACGQKHGAAMPTTNEIVGDFMRSALSPNGKIFESFRVLLLRPGELTRAYIAGQRQRYVHPVRMYVLGVFLFVAVVSLNAKWREWQQQPLFEVAAADVLQGEKKPSADLPTGPQRTGEKFGQSMKQTLPAWMNEWIKMRTERSGAESAEQLRIKAMRAMTANYSLLFALMLPFTALVNRALYLRRGFSYAAHVVYMLHGTAASCLILMVGYATNLTVIYYPLMLVSTAWFVLAAKRAFAVSLWSALWRYALLMIPVGVFSVVLGFAFATITVILG
jgi:Protein of unknown function (DUF3667)